MEVGGRLVVESADFTVMPRDKVGLVGRNGAGKTSLFQVLGGESEPTAGRVHPQGRRSATCPRTRASPACSTAAPPSPTSSPGRGIDDELERIEKLRIAMEEDPTSATSRATAGPRTSSARTAATPPTARPARIAAGLGLGPSRIDLPIGVLSGGERRRVELARILFAGSDVLLPRRADEPPRRRRQGVAARLPARLPRRAARHQPRPRPARRGDHPRPPPRPPGRGRHRPHRRVQGHVHASTATSRAADEERLSRKAAARRPRRSPGCRRFVDRFGAKATKAAMAHSKEKQIARLEADKVDEIGAADRALRVKLPAAADAGRHGASTSPGWPRRYGGPPVFDDVVVRPRPRRAAARARAQRRRQDQPAADPRRRDRGRRAATFTFGPQRQRRLLRAGARQPARRRVAARQHPRARCRRASCSPRPSCAGCSACSGCPARRSSRRPARCRAARRRSSRWRC